MKRIKSLALGMGILMFLAPLFGCGGGDTVKPTDGEAKKTQEKQQNGDQSKDKPEVMIWHYYATTNGENFDKMIQEYNALPNSKTNVKHELIPREELLKKYTLGVGSNDLPDIAIADNPDTPSLAAMGMFIDVSDKFDAWSDNQFLPEPLKSGQYDGKQFAIPLRSNCLALWLNNEHMEKAGLSKSPESFDELLEFCSKLKETNPDVYPLALSARKTEEGVFQFLPFYFSTGSTVFQIGGEASTRAFTLYKNLIDNKYMSSEVMNWTQGDVQKQFVSGNASMMVGGSWQIPNVAKDAPDMKYTVCLIPKDVESSSVLGGENIGITKAAKDPDACWDFMMFILGTDNNVRFNTLGGAISPHSNVTPKEQYPDNEPMQVFIEQFKTAKTRGPLAQWGEVSALFQDAMQQVLTGEKTPEEATKAAGEKMAELEKTIK